MTTFTPCYIDLSETCDHQTCHKCGNFAKELNYIGLCQKCFYEESDFLTSLKKEDDCLAIIKPLTPEVEKPRFILE